ncbi:hypothetical protein [Paremcibacter congregatus]|nr:hypothetical protein [Paremcibacter congregatus]
MPGKKRGSRGSEAFKRRVMAEAEEEPDKPMSEEAKHHGGTRRFYAIYK